MAHVKRYSFFMPDDLKAGLEALRERDGMPESEAIRRALAEFLKQRRIAIAKKGGTRKRR